MKRLVALVATLLCLAMPATALAYNPLDPACKAGSTAADSSACQSNGNDPISGPNGVIKKASLIIASIAGVAAVIIIIVAGLQYVTANGDAQRITGARNAIVGAVIGLVVIVAAQGIILLVLSKL